MGVADLRGSAPHAGDAGRFAVELALPPKALSPNHVVRTKGRYHAKRRATKSYREECFYQTKAAMPAGWGPRAVGLTVEYRCSRFAIGYVARDEQNAIAAMKAAIDGMVDAGMAPNDSKNYLTWDAVALVTVKCLKGDGITVIVRGIA